ncbi:hypothetical protein ANCDUO_25387 [Ancylostoma duodenale]|uniref:Uncharacterized protein n=1 Tax=Ancylostoma duodenale TaxID=51022 RepID=A0A0C2C4J7_9BILA|nr:hypothetical protein ANCDUO_25387 [Ancylostoma duodenale]
MQRLARIRILEPEDPSTVSPSERRLRKLLALSYRLSVSVFLTAHLFDFLFSSVWMHGYIWSLNLPIDLDMSDKSAGAIVYHQLEQDFMKKSDHRVGVLPVVRLTFRGAQSLTALVQRLSLRRITCPAP